MAINLDRAPSDDELDDWICREGEGNASFTKACEQAAERLIEVGEIVPVSQSVPYGSTMVDMDPEFDMPEKVLRAVAFEWWENGDLLMVVNEGNWWQRDKPWRELTSANYDGGE